MPSNRAQQEIDRHDRGLHEEFLSTQCPICESAEAPSPRGKERFEEAYAEDATFTRRFFGDILLEGLLIVVTLVIGWYIWLFFTAKTAQTPAKRLLNIYILDANTEQPVSAGRVWAREVLVKSLLFGFVSNFTLGIPVLVNYGWALFDDNGQALHDKIVGTEVVYAPYGLPELLEAPADSTHRLRELKALRDDGVITESEFEAKKDDLLREL